MNSIEELMALIEENKHLLKYDVPQNMEVIIRSEELLGLTYPEDFKKTLNIFGLRKIGSFELYGIPKDGNLHAVGVANAIWLTLEERKSSSLPTNLLIIASTGFGEYYVLACAGEALGTVSIWDPGISESEDDLEVVALSFSEFLEGIISQNRE